MKNINQEKWTLIQVFIVSLLLKSNFALVELLEKIENIEDLEYLEVLENLENLEKNKITTPIKI